MTTWGISPSFPGLFLTLGQVTNALLTRSPLRDSHANTRNSSFDLHVLSTPPAFILSQDQTLRKNIMHLAMLKFLLEIGRLLYFLSLFSC